MSRFLRLAWLPALLGLFLLLDTSYSFWQHLQEPLDGDLANIVVPNESYRQVLTDPLGVAAIWHGQEYAAPNRFFAHAALSGYFLHVPLLLQRFVAPLDSVYLACALLKTAIQLLLLGMLAAYAVEPVGWSGRRYVVALALLAPLFHVSGYNMQMGLIDASITYTVFYALPSGLLLLFFLPFYRALWRGQAVVLSWAARILLAGLAVVLALGGPLVPGVVGVVCALVLGWHLWQGWQQQAALPVGARLRAAFGNLPAGVLPFFLLIGGLSLYSLAVGRYNSENQWSTLPVLARYGRLPFGVYYQITPKLGIPLLLLMLLLNRWLLRRYRPGPAAGQLLRLLNWIGVFSLLYILLLPLGGYRSYRPDILRRDTVQPLLLALFGFHAAAGLYLAYHLRGRSRRWYLAGLALFTVGLTLADKPNGGKNACERAKLAELAASPEKTVRLGTDCTVVEWNLVRDPANSAVNMQLLNHWNVVWDSEKRFYQPE